MPATDFIHLFIWLSSWLFLCLPYGECRTSSHNTVVQPSEGDDYRLTKSAVTQVSNNFLDEGRSSKVLKVTTLFHSISSNSNINTLPTSPRPISDESTTRGNQSTERSKQLTIDENEEENKPKLLGARSSKKVETVDEMDQEDASKTMRRKIVVDENSTTRSTSRGRLKFHVEQSNSTSELSINSSPTDVNVPALLASQELVTATRSGKNSLHQWVGSDGYVFERTADLQAEVDRDKESEDSAAEPHESTSVFGKKHNNMDSIQNFNDNAAKTKLTNIMRRPQGFTLPTESRTETDVLWTPFNPRMGSVLNANSINSRKKVDTGGDDKANSVRGQISSTDNFPVNKNEISRKPIIKPNFDSRGVNVTAGGNNMNESSLPITSAVWTLAGLRTPNNVKIQKKPGMDTTKRYIVDTWKTHKTMVISTTIKPFMLWSTKLQKTTIEEIMDSTTTLKTSLEEDAETIFPIDLSGPKLINTSHSHESFSERSIIPELVGASNKVSDLNKTDVSTRASTMSIATEEDIQIDLVDNTKGHSETNHSSDLAVDDLSKHTDSFSQFNYTIYQPEVVVSRISHFNNKVVVNETPHDSNKEGKKEVVNDAQVSEDGDVKKSLNISQNTTLINTSNEGVMWTTTKEPFLDIISNQSLYDSSDSAVKAVSSNTDNAESNVILDRTYRSKESKEHEMDSNSVQEKKANISISAKIEKELVNIHNNNSVIADKNLDMEVTHIAPHMYEIDLRAAKMNVSTVQYNIQTPVSTYDKDVKISASLSSTRDMNLTEKTDDEMMTTTISMFSSRPASMWIVSATSSSAFPAVVSSTQSPPTKMYTSWSSDDDMSTDMLTSLPISSPTAANKVNVTILKKKLVTEANFSSEEALTTVINIVQNVSSTYIEDNSSVYPLFEEVTSLATSTSRTTEELSTVTSFKPSLPPENVPGYLMLFFKASFADICQTSSRLRETLFQYITQRSIRVQSMDQVVMVIDPKQCEEPDRSVRIIPVPLYVVDDFGSYDKNLIDELKRLLEEENPYNLPIHEVVFKETNIVPNNSRIIAAIIITTIAAVCFVLLIFLMCTIKNRQKMSHGQRCIPVSAGDDYILDNISECNSIKRKGIMRASKRSYGNLAFDDPAGPSMPLTYNGLLKACDNRMNLDNEFSQIPLVIVKPDELPPGVEIKNRYSNVIPLPETRVSLSSISPSSSSVLDYINANYVKGFKDVDKFYIACQAPLRNTVEDFWKMVWKEQSKVIIMLTRLAENGVEKCVEYLPPSEVLDCHRLFGDFQITLKKREVKEKYVLSTVQLKNMENNVWREIHHLWYTNWPTQGVPNEQSSIIAFLIEARVYMRNSPGPHVIHCSPGTGRTGTVLAIDICIRDYELSRSVNIPSTVAKLRRCRAGAVQTKEQYAFIYKVLALYAKKLNGGAFLDSM